MTAEELRKLLNDKYGISRKPPPTYEVDHETYANVCQAILDNKFEQEKLIWDDITGDDDEQGIKVLAVAVGLNKGIMFWGIELVLKR